MGNARTFLAAWLGARSAGGQVVLRIEDIDRDRVSIELEREQIADLAWLGLDWDEGPDVGGAFAPYRQSECLDRYREALAQLSAQGDAFACVCSRKEVALAGGAPHEGEETRYPGTCRGRFASADAALSETGRESSFRLQVEPGELAFADLLAGEQRIDTNALVGDPLIFRKNGWPAYQLAVVVDDAFMRIDQVVRGDDLLSSTARQLLLYQALGLNAPSQWAHLALVRDESGGRMAKRDGSLALRSLREAGVAPERVIGLLAQSLGLQASAAPLGASELVGEFAWERIPREPVTITERDAAALR